VTSEGGHEGASRKIIPGSLSLAIFSGPLINYAIIRPLLIPDMYHLLDPSTVPSVAFSVDDLGLIPIYDRRG